MRLVWKQGESASEDMVSYSGSAMVHGDTAYFSKSYTIFTYKVSEDKWSRLNPPCIYEHFSMAIILGRVTTIGGYCGKTVSDLFCLSSGKSLEARWESVLPPLPTGRMATSAFATHLHLVVAGGKTDQGKTSLVEVMDIDNHQWFSITNRPPILQCPRIMHHRSSKVYFYEDNRVFSCSIVELLRCCLPNTSGSSAKRSDGGIAWTRLPDIPSLYSSTLASIGAHLLAIGGDNKSGTIYCYDKSTDSWRAALGPLPTPRSDTLVAVDHSHKKLVVVGGEKKEERYTFKSNITEIAFIDIDS